MEQVDPAEQSVLPPPPAAARSAPAGRWLRCLRPSPVAATTRLILLPHAGGGSNFFRDWAASLPADIEPWAVQYPGRERRAAEPPPGELSELVMGTAGEVLPLLDRPTGFFGHSMGAVVGYELLRHLESAQPVAFSQVAHFFVSARQAPHRPRRTVVHALPDDEFVAVLRAHGGTHDALLDDPELRELFLPVLRNDYRLAETHRPTPVSPPLDIDITVLTGDDDPSVNASEAARWADAGQAEFTHHRLSGGHFYLVPRLAEVTDVVTRRLRASAGRRCPT